MQRNNEQISEFKEKLVAVNRVSKTVKGGRNMRFSALMVVGDEKGRVGCGMGKAAEIPEAIRKGLDAAKKEMRTIPISGTTIPHEVTGVFGTGKVKLLPAPEGARRPRSRGHQGHRHQVHRLQQQDQHGQGYARGPQAASQRRGSRPPARQDRGRDSGLRR